MVLNDKLNKEFKETKKIDNKEWFCESVSDKWLMNKEDEEIYYYNISKEE